MFNRTCCGYCEMTKKEQDTASNSYPYYISGYYPNFERTRKGCTELGRLRFNPLLGDVDYLIFKLRRPIIETWLREITGSDLVVLDIGGRIQPYRTLIEQRAKHYIAVDLLMEGLVTIIATAEQLPLKEGSTDVILCNDMLQYVPNPVAAVNEMFRTLRPGGRLILSTRGSYPEHHDEYWRFLPHSLRYLTRLFSSTQIEPEGYSIAGTCVFLNVLLHRDIKNERLMRIATKTTIPFLNILGLCLDRLVSNHTRSTCGYSILAIK
jgi:SAM-dependent methyltransferase